jgi:hypothetical protein
MEKQKFIDAKSLQLACTNKDEQAIVEIALDIVKNLNLDEECLLSCILYYPYIKTAIYTPPSEKESKSFDENRHKQEEEKKEKINQERLKFKKDLGKTFGENIVIFLHALKMKI